MPIGRAFRLIMKHSFGLLEDDTIVVKLFSDALDIFPHFLTFIYNYKLLQ